MNKIERTFDVPVPLERAWKAMTDPAELNQWYFPIRPNEDGSLQTEICGVERQRHVIEGEALRFFRTRSALTGREGFGVTPGVREMHVAFESTDRGTRVRLTHSGWGDNEDAECDRRNTECGVDETVADLQLYLRTGVAFQRHLHGEKCDLGIAGLEEPEGVVVCAVQAGSFADRAGMKPGDQLVELDGAGLFGLAELAFYRKLRTAGHKATARWIRQGTLMEGSAELGELRRQSA